MKAGSLSGRLATGAALVALLVASAGCDCDGRREKAIVVRCATTASVSISSPTFNLPATVVSTTGGSCLDRDGTCGHNASVLFTTPPGEVEGNGLVLSFVVARSAIPGSYALVGVAGPVFTLGTLYWYGERNMVFHADLIVQSGVLTVTRNDAEQFSGTFTVELETADGQHHLSMTGGSFDTGRCSARTEEVCVVDRT